MRMTGRGIGGACPIGATGGMAWGVAMGMAAGIAWGAGIPIPGREPIRAAICERCGFSWGAIFAMGAGA